MRGLSHSIRVLSLAARSGGGVSLWRGQCRSHTIGLTTTVNVTPLYESQNTSFTTESQRHRVF